MNIKKQKTREKRVRAKVAAKRVTLREESKRKKLAEEIQRSQYLHIQLKKVKDMLYGEDKDNRTDSKSNIPDARDTSLS